MEQNLERAVQKLERIGLFSFQSSLSIRCSDGTMLITRRERCTPQIGVRVSYWKRELKWEEGSWDLEIHARIYRQIPRAKVIAFLTPPNLMALGLGTRGDQLPFRDRWSQQVARELAILRIHQWEKQQQKLFYRQLEEWNLILIPALGLYILGRSWEEVVQKGATLEQGAQIALRALLFSGGVRQWNLL